MFNVRELKSALAFIGLSIKDFAKKIKVSETAMYRRLNNPDLFKYDEILVCYELFGKERTNLIFFGY